MTQLDIYIAERATHDERVGKLVELADAILTDEPELELPHLAAEIVRATVGVGRYALPQRQAASTRNRPYGGSRQHHVRSGP
jgi:hypothetical protein